MVLQRLYGFLFFTLLFLMASSTKSQLVGSRKTCSKEGAKVSVDTIEKGACFSCVCKNGYVTCTDGCPKIDGCHMLVEDRCCKRCKGCMYNGFHHPSETEWRSPTEPCTIFRCEAGVITMSQLRCHTPCSNPLPPQPGECCPTCPECRMNDQIVTDDRDVTSDDPCLQCRCTGRRMVCSKKACPVLQCSPHRQVHPAGECCPRCVGTRALVSLKDTCFIKTSLFRHGHNFSVDKCTNCTCENETSICKRYTCPILDCAPDLQKSVPGSCCKKCEIPQLSGEFNSVCFYNNNLYQDGEQWKLDACKSCICTRGMPSCAITRCNTTSTACTYGTKFQKVPGECCPRCVEVEGACMVFGDPHYKTFDGKIYTFKGIGKYQLTADCTNNTFSIGVANVLVDGNSSSTKRVSVKYLNTRLNLQQKGRIKFNGTIISAPFKVDGKFRLETKEENSVDIILSNGVRVFWNFKSFVEVIVPANMKNNVCGLCGNFNYDIQDDLTSKPGKVLSNGEISTFGASWCLSRKTECAKKLKNQKNKSTKLLKKKSCKFFNSDIFSTCRSKLSVQQYSRACKMDMDHCKGHKCYCDSLMAYARECERLGVDLISWQKHTLCDSSNLKSRRRRPKKLHGHNRHIQNQEALLLKQMPKFFNKTRSSKGVPLT
ncbi:BMP-binding endothelial regulator protein-like isoform X1 [Diorhabda carinulata]|uniref:BMP-binding endothelial regulator protein-like isoform X1 n=2 Tax=Diorhabda carinulata TaxID=1163345 RepID=UPI0025A25885|nr:BMP-binding endothelial regulator protein-like isoform X1 [Diorhabda carinulata]